MRDLHEIAHMLVSGGKGIFAADESPKSADKRLTAHGEAAGPLSRWEFRELFLSTPDIERYLSGVILHEETLFQTADDDVSFSKKLRDKGILPGIKVDEGTEPMPGSPKELITKGLVGLSERLNEYRERHEAAFTKWRAVISIDGDKLPTSACLVENAKRLASYARCSQEAGLVPIVEPDVLFDGNHSRTRAREVNTMALRVLMEALTDQAVDLEGVVVKAAMSRSGLGTGRVDTPEEVGEDTVESLLATIPPNVAGVVFISGGQTPEQAIDNLAGIIRYAKAKNVPWPLSFSFSRAFQEDALTIWKGKDENVPSAREAFLSRLKQATVALAQ